MKVELQPEETLGGCPMCGSKARLSQSLGGLVVAAQFWVKCEDCGLTQPAAFNRTDALARWNRRDG